MLKNVLVISIHWGRKRKRNGFFLDNNAGNLHFNERKVVFSIKYNLNGGMIVQEILTQEKVDLQLRIFSIFISSFYMKIQEHVSVKEL